MTDPSQMPSRANHPGETAALAQAGRAAPAADARATEAFAASPDDPLSRFLGLLALAQELSPGATAMTLSTASAEGRPSGRIVLLKAADEAGFTFFTNFSSRKAREARDRPDVSLLFWWPQLEVQVRIEGPCGPVSDAEADAYFATRPRGSQLGAWASDQSAPLATRAQLERRLAALRARFEGKTVPRPPGWSGLRVRALAMEFWKNREDRLHERELYTRARPGDPWVRSLLNP